MTDFMFLLQTKQADPYELNRINPSDNPALANRLNGLLLATKTCTKNSCRDPWGYIHPDGSVQTLKDALDPKYDSFYASLPKVHFAHCLNFQSPANEEPFFPGFDPSAPYAFAQQFRASTAALGNATYPGLDDAVETIPDGHFGAAYADLSVIESQSRELTDAEINGGIGGDDKKRDVPYYGYAG